MFGDHLDHFREGCNPQSLKRKQLTQYGVLEFLKHLTYVNWGYYCYPHFIDEEAINQKGQGFI